MTNREWINSLSDKEFISEVEISDEMFSDWACVRCKLKNGTDAACLSLDRSKHCPEEYQYIRHNFLAFLKDEKITKEEDELERKISKEGEEKLAKEREACACEKCLHNGICKFKFRSGCDFFIPAIWREENNK